VKIKILLKCSESKRWREQFLFRKLLIANEKAAYRKINCIFAVELRNMGIYL
jgi:hypothetical protein